MFIPTFTMMAMGLAMLVSYHGCNNSTHGNHSMRGSGHIITATRSVSECDGITLRSQGNVYLTHGDDQSIRIEADDNIMGRVVAEREGGTLVVGLPEGKYSDVTLRFYVSMKHIRCVELDGAGTIETTNQFESESMDCTINGAGSIDLKGNCDKLRCTINGAGSMDLRDFKAKEARAELNGAGKCSVFATDRVYGIVNGVGVITYYGNPGQVNSHLSGIGFMTNGD